MRGGRHALVFLLRHLSHELWTRCAFGALLDADGAARGAVAATANSAMTVRRLVLDGQDDVATTKGYHSASSQQFMKRARSLAPRENDD